MPTSYVDKILEEYDLLQCKPSPVPGNESLRKKIEAEEPLSAVEHRKYRRIVGQLLWLSSIRPDIQYAVKELSRGLTSPTEDHQAKVKMLLRYLAGSKACVLTLRPRVKLRPEMSSLDVVAYVDSDWARLRSDTQEYFRCFCVLQRLFDCFTESHTADDCYFVWRSRALQHRLGHFGMLVREITSHRNEHHFAREHSRFHRFFGRKKHVDALRSFEENSACRTSFSVYARVGTARHTAGEEGSRYFESC